MNYSVIKELIKSLPKTVDLTLDKHAKIIFDSVNTVLKENCTLDEIETIEHNLINKQDKSLIFILLVLKITKSKLLVNQIKKPLFISVVFAVYKEHNRIKNKTEHPHGEDFLLKKVEQLQWLFQDQKNIDWELVIVDDGCPDNSGKIAQDIIDQNSLNKKARVLFLKEAIENNFLPAKQLQNTSESQKGGSIIYGMWDAIKNSKKNNQIVIYTDADLSTHLGQLMLLIEPLLNKAKLVAIGSRREPNSIVIKKGSRNDRGKLFIYLWKRMIPNLGNILDTQCGFKAFRAEIISELIEDLIEKKFAFDIELLLKSELKKKDCITKVPIAWIDSEAASTTTDLQPYLAMLKSIVKMSKKYFSDMEKPNEFNSFIEALSQDDFEILLENIPAAIADRNPEEFTTYNAVKVADFLQ